MVRPERLELPAYWFEASRSIQLSYGRTHTEFNTQSAILIA